jgi:hypothetical protein
LLSVFPLNLFFSRSLITRYVSGLETSERLAMSLIVEFLDFKSARYTLACTIVRPKSFNVSILFSVLPYPLLIGLI